MRINMTMGVSYQQMTDRDGYAIDKRTPTHATDEQIEALQALFTGWLRPVVDSDYNYANTPESFSVTFHDLTAEQVRILAHLTTEETL